MREYTNELMKAVIYISGVIGEETTLKDVIRQYKSFDSPTEALFKIHSEGGDVDEGDSICEYMDGLKAIHKVDTWTDKAYSIAAKLFSKGDEREVEDIDKAIMIHFAWVDPKNLKINGNAADFERVAAFLRETEEDFSNYYSEFLDVDEVTARNLLDNETFISGEEAIELGFATKLKSATKAVAKYDLNTNLKTSTMSKKTKGEKLLEAFAAYFKTEDKVDANALILQDSNGTEIDFPDLEDGDIPKVGDSAMIDGASPEDEKEYIMPSLEDKIVVFMDGKISEIKDAESEEEEEEENEDIDAKAEVIKEVMTWEVEATNTSFEIGDSMTYEYDEETFSFSAGEYFVPSIGKSVICDASGVIVAHKEVTSPNTDEEEIDVSAQLEEMVEKVETKISAKYEAKFKKQEADLKRLNKLVGSKEFDGKKTEPKTEAKEVDSSLSRGAQILASRKKRK